MSEVDNELKKLLGEDTEPTPPAEPAPNANPAAPASEEDQEMKAKAEQKANLDKAILEAQDTLRKVRKGVKDVKSGKSAEEIEEDELPRINMDDPSSKAWVKHIRSNVAPLEGELEKEKDEIRGFALREFLKERPSLRNNPEKLKAVMQTYERIKTSSERTREGVTIDLEKAYAAEHSEELIAAARQRRVEDARNDAIFSDIGVSRGSTSYGSNTSQVPRKFSNEEVAQLAKWGMSPADQTELEKKYPKNG